MGKELIYLTGDLYAEYERLILERDQARRDAGGIWTEYLKRFGSLMTENFRLHVACIRRKKEIAYITRVINRGGALNVDDMKRSIGEEMASYQMQLADLTSAAMRSRKAKRSSDSTVMRARRLYRQIARIIHPDLHPEMADSEDVYELWSRTQEAYGKNDVKALEEILVLARRLLDGDPILDLKLTPDELRGKIDEVKKEIRDIRTTSPYTYRKILEDPEATRHKIDELEQETEEYTAYLKHLTDTASTLLIDAGIAITWSWEEFDKEMDQWTDQTD